VALLVGAEQSELDLAYIHKYVQDYGTVQPRVPCCGGVSQDPSVLYTHRLTNVSVAGLAAEVYSVQGHSAVARITPLAI
jgi:hypothetical protein